MKYLLGSGMYGQGEHFGKIWALNNSYADVQPYTRCILQVGDAEIRPWLGNYNYVAFHGNLGHVGDLLSGGKINEFCGWSAGVMALAMMAYNAECDFIYKEEDCLAFGPWVKRMYSDMGDGDMVFGGKMASPPYMASAQSLFLIRHEFIPDFVAAYLSMGKDGDPQNLPESKFFKLKALFPGRIKDLSFGVDRERPIPYEKDVFYAQKLTEQELNELRTRNLIR